MSQFGNNPDEKKQIADAVIDYLNGLIEKELLNIEDIPLDVNDSTILDTVQDVLNSLVGLTPQAKTKLETYLEDFLTLNIDDAITNITEINDSYKITVNLKNLNKFIINILNKAKNNENIDQYTIYKIEGILQTQNIREEKIFFDSLMTILKHIGTTSKTLYNKVMKQQNSEKQNTARKSLDQLIDAINAITLNTDIIGQLKTDFNNIKQLSTIIKLMIKIPLLSPLVTAAVGACAALFGLTLGLAAAGVGIGVGVRIAEVGVGIAAVGAAPPAALIYGLYEAGKKLKEITDRQQLQNTIIKSTQEASRPVFPDPIRYIEFTHENGSAVPLNIIIGKYLYRMVMESSQSNRYIMTESFVENTSAKRYLHILAITMNPPPAKPVIEYLAKSDQNGVSLDVFLPEPIQPIPVKFETMKAQAIIRQNNTELNNATIDKIRLAELKQGNSLSFYIPTEEYNKPGKIQECVKRFGRDNLLLIHKHLPGFVDKYIRNNAV